MCGSVALHCGISVKTSYQNVSEVRGNCWDVHRVHQILEVHCPYENNVDFKLSKFIIRFCILHSAQCM